MSIFSGVIAGLVAGVIMGCFSQIGYWLRILKSHLILIDGKFVLQKLQQPVTTRAVYAAGILIHLVTSIVFGVFYVIIVNLTGLEIRTVWFVAVYFLALWLAMLIAALPVASQGFLGKKIHSFVWLEQLVLHIIFGFAFWWILGIVAY